jgi:Sulfotransferase family
MHVDETSAPAPFFIVGSGRSGTTLLRMMLCSHSRISIPPETWFLLPLVKRLNIDRALNPSEIECAIALMTEHHRWPVMNLDSEELRRRVRQITDRRLRDVVDTAYRAHMEAHGKVRWGDKTPLYIEIVPQLARLFPGARFIHLIRDGRDVARSFQNTHWVSPWLHDNTEEWVSAMKYQRRWERSELRNFILPIRYEDLVLDTEATLRKTCEFLGERFEAQMLAWEHNVDAQIPDRERKYHKKLKLKIGSEGVARWKREMGARETFVAEAFMGSQLARLGYERRYPSPLWNPIFALTRLCCRLILPAVQWQSRTLRSERRRVRLRP